MKDLIVEETALAAMAKKYRQQSGKSGAQAARELKVAAPTLFQAEEIPKQSLTKLRLRIIETYSEYEVIGPVYLLRKKK